jgi:hypothetical protein
MSADEGGDDGAEAADTTMPPLHDRAFYDEIARGHGVADPNAAVLVVGLRGVTRDGKSHETTSVQAYDDVIAVLGKDGSVVELAASTHPWFASSKASDDADGDGVPDVGMIRPGRYQVEPRPGNEIAGAPTFHVTTGGSDRVAGWRDTNHDGVFDDEERAASEARNDTLGAVLFHQGGQGAPAPIGCQVFAAKDIRRLVQAVGGSGARFDYVLVDAP